MNLDKNPYKGFESFVLRSPLLPLTFFKKLTEDKVVSHESIRDVCQDKIIKEAIFLASPALYEQLEKWLAGDLTSEKEVKKIVYSILKYLSRMSSRCTPFGLFAGTTIGSFDTRTQIDLTHFSEFGRHTRLDMNYLVALSQDLVKNENIRNQLHFTPNTSIYQIGQQLRYIEYHYVNSRRSHQMVALDNSDYLQTILKVGKGGASIAQLANSLVTDDISMEEAIAFVNELVDSQFLVSELEPSVSGPEFLDQLLPVLRKIADTEAIVKALEFAKHKTSSFDQKMGNDVNDYVALGESLKKLGTEFEPKFLFQTDLSIRCKHNLLNSEIQTKMLRAFTLLNKISPPTQETALAKFGKALFERYERRAVPLAQALDVEVGLGYKENQGSGDVSALIDDIVLPSNGLNGPNKLNVSSIGMIMQKKLIDAIKNEKQEIQLSESDFPELETNWGDLPDTVSSMIEIVLVDGVQKVVLSGLGGSSAANLLGRFCHGDEGLKSHTEKIVEAEYQMNSDKILAEIVHLPESRVGNILIRPSLRKYEIPYLAKSVASVDDQLTIDDLMVQAQFDGQILLSSKKYRKEVIPRLTNAHSYSNQALPIYHFLGDLQTQGKRWVGFRWDALANEYEFLPRVEYEGVIFSKARWSLAKKDIQQLIDSEDDDKALSQAVNVWRDSYQIPHYFLLVDGDNELLINAQNLTSMRLLLSTVQKRSRFTICEFLHGSDSSVKQEQNQYTNQFVVSFFNAEKLAKNKAQ